MSDPAKSAREIEDVLASIRRLVSESHVSESPVSESPVSESPVPASRVPPAVELPFVPAGQVAPRLVLTPALRVADPDDPWAPVPAQGSDRPADPVMTEEEEDPSWGLEDRLSDWGEIEDSADEAVADAIAEQSADPEAPPHADDLAQAGDLADRYRDGPGDLAAGFLGTSPVAAEFEPETGDADWPDRSAGRALHDLVLVRGQGGEAAGEEMATSADAIQTSPEVADPETETSTDPSEVETETDSQAGRSMTEDQTAQAADTPQRPAFTPVFSRRIDVRRPVADAPLDRAAGTEGDAEAEAEAEVEAEDMRLGEDSADDAHADVEDLGELRQPFTFPETEDGLLDEDTLRDIIAEVVREELQGVLGQRITRNVRKMVRREIRLALAAEDFE